MPIYVYECPRCKNGKELIRTIAGRDEPVSCDVCSSGTFTNTLMRRQATAASVKVAGFNAKNGYASARTFTQRHTGRLAGIKTEVKGNPEGFSDGLHS